MKYEELAKVYGTLSSTSKRLEKTFHIATLLRHTPKEDVGHIVLLLQGRIFPVWDERKIGVATKMVAKAISIMSGATSQQVEELWKQTGDLGLVAMELAAKKKQATLFSEELTVIEVFQTVRKLAEISGPKSVDLKLKLIAKLMSNATPIEAQFITRTILEDLRVGVGEGVLRDAIAWAYAPNVLGILIPCPNCHELVPNGKQCISCGTDMKFKFDTLMDALAGTTGLSLITDMDEEKDLVGQRVVLVPTSEGHAREEYNDVIQRIQDAFDITNDFGKVAHILLEKGLHGLEELHIQTGIPLNLMLYQKAESVEEGFKIVGTPAALEYKYDGFRMEIHKNGEEVILYTRRLENVTERFPDVVSSVMACVQAEKCILDAEVVGVNKQTGKFLAFQHISKRIKRKYDIKEMALQIPVCVNVFDILLHEEESLIKHTYGERREVLQKIVREKKDMFVLSDQIETTSVETAEEFYKKALHMGNEGIMMKNLEGIYQPGKRVGFGVKVKPVMETLDLVVIGAEWGEGKRAGSLTSFTLACRDEDNNFLEIGNMSTGLKEKKTNEEDVTYGDVTELLQEHIEAEQGRTVILRPALVIEVHYEEIQKSPNNSSGYALRFPRFVRLREDRSTHEISDIALVEQLFRTQRNR